MEFIDPSGVVGGWVNSKAQKGRKENERERKKANECGGIAKKLILKLHTHTFYTHLFQPYTNEPPRKSEKTKRRRKKNRREKNK